MQSDKDGDTALDIRKRKRQERDPFHQGQIQERSQLKQRDYQIDLSARLGKTQVGGGIMHGLKLQSLPLSELIIIC